MPAYVVFLRAVNVPPRWVKMARLRQLLTDAGFTDVQTYIQSGNVRVTSRMRSQDRLRTRMEQLIEAEFGFPVPCLVRSGPEVHDIAQYADGMTSPFGSDVADVRRYVTLLPAPVTDEQVAFCDVWSSVPGERFHAHHREIYWWLAKPMHQAKVGNARLGESATTRDLNVIRELAKRWSAPPASR